MSYGYIYDDSKPIEKREPWWALREDQHDHVFRDVNTISMNQLSQRARHLHNMQLYSTWAVSGFSGGEHNQFLPRERLKRNLIKAVVDTAVSSIATSKPKVMFMTMGGNRKMQRKAKGLTKFLSGQFYQHNQYETSVEVFRDSAVFGTGFQHIGADRGKIISERVFPDEIRVDDNDARNGRPSFMYRVQEVPREIVLDMYPKKHHAEIKEATVTDGQVGFHDGISDMITLVEAWILPRSGAPGQHVVCISNKTLHVEEHKENFFPIIPYRFCTRSLGYLGESVPDELGAHQTEMNFLLMKVQESMNIFSTQLWAKKGSISNVNSLTNKPGALNEFAGNQAPVAISPAPIHPQYFEQIERIWQAGFEQIGVNELTATGRKPAGLNSGAAIRNHQDIQSKKFLEKAQRFENFHMRCGRAYIAAARKLDKETPGGYRVMAQGVKSLEEINFSEVDLDEDKYIMRPYPVSLLPDTPSGKIEVLKELSEIDESVARRMMSQMEFLDLESVLSRVNAKQNYVTMVIDRILDEGIRAQPDPNSDLELGIEMCLTEILKAQVDNVEEERIELLRQYLNDSIGLLQGIQAGQAAQAPPPQQGGQMGPGAVPEEQMMTV